MSSARERSRSRPEKRSWPAPRHSLPRLTNTQAVQLEQHLAVVEERLQDIAILIGVRYGDDSQPAIRAGEAAEVGIGKNRTASGK